MGSRDTIFKVGDKVRAQLPRNSDSRTGPRTGEVVSGVVIGDRTPDGGCYYEVDVGQVKMWFIPADMLELVDN